MTNAETRASELDTAAIYRDFLRMAVFDSQKDMLRNLITGLESLKLEFLEDEKKRRNSGPV